MSTAPAAPVSLDDVMPLLGRLNCTYTNTESLLIHLIAGLAGTSKDAALIIYLTLNTTRARADLVERLAKMESRNSRERDRVLAATRKLMKLSGLRNRYNHCIFAVDPDGGHPRTILMRISDRKDAIKVGQTSLLDGSTLQEINLSIQDLTELNKELWALIQIWDYPI
jgi:hypothetical protein